MNNDSKGIIGAIIYWILVFLFIKILFNVMKVLYH